ncbi:MAG: hypothetical protein ACIAXF_04020 [Phycisphaerales bacterium JB063]
MFEDDGLVDDYPLEPTPEDPHQRGPVAALLWGAFLGCSWTWIIGMVFPALLLRDYGLKGWAAFALPNVIGAAAMGTVLFKPSWSADIVRKHAVACHNFSVVTIAFHLYVITWLFTGLFGFAAVPMIVAAVGACVGLGMRNRNTAMLYVAVGVALLSWGCFVWGTIAPGAWDLAQWSHLNARLTHIDFLYFIPCSVLGFLLCPYLDLTFHRARINTQGSAGPSAFAFGFGVVFFLMIIFSVCYGAQLLPFIAGDPDAVLPGIWLVLLGVHLTIQAAFTLTIHARETLEDRVTGGISLPWLIGACGIAIVLGFAVRIDDLPVKAMTGGLSWGEAGYRGFLLLYGTVFPAYVWLVMIPTGRGPLTPLGFEIRTGIYALSSALAFALAWISFVQGDTFVVPYIFGLLIVSRIAIQCLPTQKYTDAGYDDEFDDYDL